MTWAQNRIWPEPAMPNRKAHMTRVFALLALIAVGLAPALEAAASETITECVVTAVKDGGAYENEYDFTFAQSPFLVVDLNSQANGKSVTIGALKYAQSEGVMIRSVYAYGTTAIDIAPSGSDERFHITLKSREQTGEFQRLVNGAWVAVAVLDCK